MAYLGNQPTDPISVSTAAPSSPKNGAVWFNSELGETYVYYDDGNTAQWVQTNPAGSAGPRGPAGYSVSNVYALTGTEIDPDNGGIQTKTLSANTTFTENFTSGESVLLMLQSGATHTVTWPSISWVSSSGNTAPTLTDSSTVLLWKVTSTLYGAYVGSYA